MRACKTKTLLRCVILAAGLNSLPTFAQTEDPVREPVIEAAETTGPIEEVVVIGRFFDSTQALINERIDDEVVSDVLGADTISRLGDSTVAEALRRIAGLSLVNEKFVYVRGLGERYSSTSLNSAAIPSPDLTRNVIPLDIFPTSIVESLRVQKSYSADMPASFGGGSVDIRSTGIPDGFTWSLEVGSGYNFENDGKILTYPGGSDDRWGTDDGTRALASEISAGVQRFQGNVDVQGILSTLVAEGNTDATLAEAQLQNRELALGLYRDIGVEKKDIKPDMELKGSIGSNWYLGEDWEFGFMLGGSYDRKFRERTRVNRNFRFPEERTDTKLESAETVDIAGNLNLGLRFTDDHQISTTTLYLRNTDDETAIRDFFNENREVSDGIGFRGYRFQFEERDIWVNQITGSHRIGDATRAALGWSFLDLVPDDLGINWFYSDSEANTDIPSQINIDAQTVTDPLTGQVISSAVSIDATTADYRFTELDDEVENYGWSVSLPLRWDNSSLELSGGFAHDRKARTYAQQQFSIGALSVRDTSILEGPLSSVFSDENILDTRNNFVFDLQGTNNQSYIAATMTDAWYGKFDYEWNATWRVSAGMRWEDYRQVAVDWNINGFTVDNPQISNDPEVLESGAFQRDDWFPAVSVTYMSQWLAETFQLRFGWSETAVRPDLREITDASYIDPITGDLVDGNPGVIPSDVSNYDARAEWFFSNGDNFTVSLFYKDIDNPIEFFESAASDTTIAREIINAESAEVYGVEFEGLKTLGFIGGALESFFLQGNFTLQSSELVAGPEADAPTNDVRDMTGASDYVVNMMLGYDAPSGKHTASLIYNVFGERLYVAGRLGAPDGFEQPFHSLDLTYSWYPTENLTVKAKFKNLLDETITIEREGVNTFKEKPGQEFAVSVQYAF